MTPWLPSTSVAGGEALDPRVHELRSAVRVGVGGGVAVFVALAILFGLALESEPQPGDSCTTGLYEGLYATVLAPVHLLAFGGLAGLVAWCKRRWDGAVGRRTSAALAAVSVFALATTVHHPLMDWPALVALLAVGPVALVLAVVALVVVITTLRNRALGAVERWRRLLGIAIAGLWLAIVVGMPASVAAAWVNGAGLFCF